MYIQVIELATSKVFVKLYDQALVDTFIGPLFCDIRRHELTDPITLEAFRTCEREALYLSFLRLFLTQIARVYGYRERRWPGLNDLRTPLLSFIRKTKVFVFHGVAWLVQLVSFNFGNRVFSLQLKFGVRPFMRRYHLREWYFLFLKALYRRLGLGSFLYVLYFGEYDGVQEAGIDFEFCKAPQLDSIQMNAIVSLCSRSDAVFRTELVQPHDHVCFHGGM